MWRSSCCGLVIVLLCLINVVQIQAQCQKPNIDGNRILATGTFETSYSNGATLTFTCATGYLSVNQSASKTMTCQGGTWSALALQCKKRSCGSPGEVLNGEYDLTNGIEFGSTITVKCHDGYILSGRNNYRSCLATGIWDGHPPLCDAVRCPKPPSIANGQIDSNEDFYSFGQAVTYSCVSGTFLFGAKTLTCSADAMFKPDPPTCTSVRCPAVRVKNGYRSGGKNVQSYELREFLQFECDKGYVMEGSNHIVCQQSGWEPAPPTCKSIAPIPGPDPGPDPGPGPGPDPGPAPTPDPNEPKSNTTTILGIVGGIVAVVVLVVCGGFFYKKKNSGNGSFGKVATRNEEL